MRSVRWFQLSTIIIPWSILFLPGWWHARISTVPSMTLVTTFSETRCIKDHLYSNWPMMEADFLTFFWLGIWQFTWKETCVSSCDFGILFACPHLCKSMNSRSDRRPQDVDILTNQSVIMIYPSRSEAFWIVFLIISVTIVLRRLASGLYT